jgi:hypothetical protein
LRQFRQHFTIEADRLGFEQMLKASIRQVVCPHRRINTRLPEGPESAFLFAAVAICVLAGL